MTPKRANPYVGPRSFETNETLYGRSRELRMLSAQLISERVVLLHSPSGAGKTSLIQAGLVPLLHEEKFHILPVARVNLEPDAEAALTPGFNRYVYSAIAALEEGLPLEQRRPLTALAGLTLDTYLNERPRPADAPRSDLLIFDQFEEILTIAPTDREGKQAFFAHLGAALRNSTRWALFAMREDYIGAIAPYVRPLPNRFEATFRLDLLGVDAALQAIQSPARGAEVDFSDEAARKLVDDLRLVQVQLPDGSMESLLGEHIEPVQLQVVCYRLWQSLAAEDTEIGLDDLAAVGDVDQSLAEYYALSISSTAAQTGLNERGLREWFETKLITQEGIRGQVLMGAEASDGLDNRAVRLLENAHIIRGEKRAGATWFELSHDRLIQPVRKNNAAWFEQNLSLFQRQAVLWVQQGHSEGLLLRGREFQQAEKEAQALELTADETAFLAACRKLREREQRERRRNTFMTILAIGATIALFVAGFFYIQARNSATQAQNSEKKANLSAATAQAASTESVAQRNVADQQKAAAQAAATQVIQAQATTESTLKQTKLELRTARNQQLSAQAELLQNTRPSLAALLALEAIKINQDSGDPISSVSYQALRDSLNHLGGSNLFNDTSRDASALAFSPDGRWFVVGHQDGSLAFWDMNDKSAAPIIEKKHSQPITRILFSKTDLAITAAGDEIDLWQVNEKDAPKYLETFKTGFTNIIDLALAPTGTWFSASNRTKVILVPIENGKIGSPSIINNAKLGAFSPDGHWFAVARFNTQSLFTIQSKFDLDAGKGKINFIDMFDLYKSPVSSMITLDIGATRNNNDDVRNNLVYAGSPASNPCATVLAGYICDLYLEAFPAEVIDKLPYLGVVSSLAFSPDGKQLIATSTSYTSQLLTWQFNNQGKLSETPKIYQMNYCNQLEISHSIIKAISSDSRWVAIGCNTGSIQVYDLQKPGVIIKKARAEKTGMARCRLPLPGCSSQGVELIDFTVKHSSIVTTIVNFDEAPLPAFVGNHDGPISNLLFSTDNRKLISLGGDSSDAQNRTISGDGFLKVWDLETGNNLFTVQLATNSGLAAVSSKTSWVATGYESNSIRFWNDQQQNYQVEPLPLGKTAFRLSADGEWLAFKSICNVETKFINFSMPTPLDSIYSLVDGAVSDTFMQNCHLLNGRELVDFSSSGNRFTSLISGQVWDISENIGDDLKPLIGSAVIGTKFYMNVNKLSPDGKWLLTGNSGVEVYLLKISEDTKQKFPLPDIDVNLDGPQKIERRYAFSYDGKWLARFKKGDEKVILLDISGQPTERIALLTRNNVIEYMAFSPDNKWLLAHGETGALLLWDMTAADPNKTLITFEGFPGLAEAHFSKSGRWLAVYPLPDVTAPVQAGSISLFDMHQMSASAKPVQLSLADTGDVHLIISADEKWLAAVGKTGDAQLWDLTENDFAKNPKIIPGLGNQITAVAISHDNSLLATGTNTGKMLLWKMDDLLAGNTPLILSGGSKAFDHLEFTPNGRWLIGSGPEQPILLWHVQFDEALKLACETVGRNLTRSEWAQYGFTEDYRATCPQWPVETGTATPTP